MAMDPLVSTVLLSLPDEMERLLHAPTRSYVRDSEATASTPVDVKEYPHSYVFIVDMPGLKSNDIKVQVEDDNILNISGERKRNKEEEGEVKYIRMERPVAKLMRKFTLPARVLLKCVMMCPAKVKVEDENILNISGEQKGNKEEEGEVNYIRMERRVAKFMRKFTLPADCNLEAISAVCQDGVLTVTVPKLPLLEPKKPKTIEVKI